MQYGWPELDSDGADDSDPALDEAEPVDDDQGWLALLDEGVPLALDDSDALLEKELLEKELVGNELSPPLD